MQIFLKVSDIEQALHSTLPSSRGQLYSGVDGLARAKAFYEQLGNPQDSYKSIHIAGTSGKGSTAYFLSHLLHAHGFKVGTHVSPHIYDIRERFMIDIDFISEQQAGELTGKIFKTIQNSNKQNQPTYYECTVGLAFQLFADQQVDYGVIETGMGGLYDSTNTINREDKLAVITRLGLDHTEILGKTIEEIAAQKAGIMNKNGQTVAIEPHENGGKEVLQQVAHRQHNSLTFFDPTSTVSNISVESSGVNFDYATESLVIKNVQLSSPAEYQVENACLALRVLQHIADSDGFVVNPVHIRQALKQAVVPARMELRNIAGRQILFDGAHNPQKLQALITSLKSFTSAPPAWLFAAKHSKDIAASLEIVESFYSSIAFTEFFQNQPVPYLKSLSARSATLTEQWHRINPHPPLDAFTDPLTALRTLVESTPINRLIVVTGSMYMIGELYQQLDTSVKHTR